jgi:hypothetical protein
MRDFLKEANKQLVCQLERCFLEKNLQSNQKIKIEQVIFPGTCFAWKGINS